ncbi:lysylphosphatidylglycerol synthase transmembrane domain-containing protein [Kineococcus rubinsiae]|uniref:lysylphosphatidylglycerol synthase transmembrane domain-containing protein n=1 Tax=Kineococcus rubinsiae TaxID=2609562 RepID=UPI0027E3C087|nr:lysylphosphatidylglycerol synthase transmembrane domain-containing protein [Kineococcus rubinsiae]
MRWRTVWRVVLAVATVAAVVVLGRRLEAADLGDRLRSAQGWWVTAAVLASTLPVLGNVTSLVALTPGRLPVVRTAAVQLATSFVNLVTPASAGGVALNMRYLHRRGVPVAAAVTTVGVVQSSAGLVTLVLVAVLLLTSGQVREIGGLVPWQVPVAVVAVFAVVAVVVRSWGGARAWLRRRVLAPLRASWPPLRATLSSPGRLTAAVLGHLVTTLGFTLTLWCAVHAFGGSAPLGLLVLVVVGSSAVAGAVPVPGGIGAAEAALVAGLVTVGVDPTTALSAALLHRLVTFWARVPLGWVLLLLLRRSGDV